mgnify:CR=1 FL=1
MMMMMACSEQPDACDCFPAASPGGKTTVDVCFVVLMNMAAVCCVNGSGSGSARAEACAAVSCREAKYKGDGGIEWRVAGWEKVAVAVRTRGHDEWAIEKKAHGHAHDTSREGGVSEAQGRQGRNEAQVPESKSSPGAEP